MASTKNLGMSDIDQICGNIEVCKDHLRSSLDFTNIIKQIDSLQIFETLMNNYTQKETNRDLQSSVKVDIVAYGLGRIWCCHKSQLQLALILLLKEHYSFIGDMYVFDPVLTDLEYDAMEKFGCVRIKYNEIGRRHAYRPTIFYMPHCHPILFDNVLRANIEPWSLGWVTVLGNDIKRIFEKLHVWMEDCGDFQYVYGFHEHTIVHNLECAHHCLNASWHLFPCEESISMSPILMGMIAKNKVEVSTPKWVEVSILKWVKVSTTKWFASYVQRKTHSQKNHLKLKHM